MPHVALPFPFSAPSPEPGVWNGLIWFQFREEQRERGHVAPIRERLCRSRRENPTLGNGDGLGSPGLSSFPGEPRCFWCKNIKMRLIPNISSCIPQSLGFFLAFLLVLVACLVPEGREIPKSLRIYSAGSQTPASCW